MELTPRERLTAAAALAAADPLEPPLSAQQIADRCASWGISIQLKPHQLEGISWLIKRYLRGVNVILGDEAGRSSYVPPEVLSNVPDPGAMAAATWFREAATAVAMYHNAL